MAQEAATGVETACVLERECAGGPGAGAETGAQTVGGSRAEVETGSDTDAGAEHVAGFETEAERTVETGQRSG